MSAARFWAKVDKSAGDDGCWIWMAAKDAYGYGQLREAGKLHRAHRYSWTLAKGVIPAGRIYVCHRCDNRACVNPAHLFLGTPADNSADMVSKNRQALGFGRHQTRLSEADVLAIRTSELSGAELAEKYGVRRNYIYDVRAGRYRNNLIGEAA